MALLQKSMSGDDLSQEMIDQIQEVMIQKAEELFCVCDQEKKGYITKADMQKLRAELPVSPDQLEVVFDSLDNNGNGRLTLREFSDGFGNFLGLPSQDSPHEIMFGTVKDSDYLYEDQEGVTDTAVEEKVFHEMMWQTGATNVFQDQDVVKAMWLKLYREEPDMASAFEEFIAKLAGDIKKSMVDFQSLEAALSSKNHEHEEEVKKLYEEMELQIKQEREKILTEEKAKERHMRGELETQLKERETQLQDILIRQQELEQKMRKLNLVETVTKQENERLQKEKDQLEAMLSESQENLEASRSYIQHIQLQQKDEKKEKARSCDDILNLGDNKNKNFMVTFHQDIQPEKSRPIKGRRTAMLLAEGIPLERESLMKQLNILKDINKRLRDDKDEAETTGARLHRSRETSRNNSTPVQGRSFISKIQYYPPTAPVDSKGQQSVSQAT